MVDVGWRRSRRKTADRGDRSDPLGQAAISYATLGWPVCVGAHLSADGLRPGRACSCDRVGCPAPGAHPVAATWQMQATVDTPTIQGWWAARPEASVILVTGRVFDVLDVPAADAMKRGVPPTEPNARTGEFTPPGVTSLARANHSAERSPGTGIPSAAELTTDQPPRTRQPGTPAA